MKCGRHKGVAYRSIMMRSGMTKFACPQCHQEVTGEGKALVKKTKGAAKEIDHDED